MENSHNQGHTPDRDSNRADRVILNDKEYQRRFDSIIENNNINPEPESTAGTIRALDSYRGEILSSMHEVNTETLRNPEDWDSVNEKIEALVEAYADAFRDLPQHLIDDGVNPEDMLEMLVEEYMKLDDQLLVDLSERPEGFIANHRTEEYIYEEFKHQYDSLDSVEQFSVTLPVHIKELLYEHIDDFDDVLRDVAIMEDQALRASQIDSLIESNTQLQEEVQGLRGEIGRLALNNNMLRSEIMRVLRKIDKPDTNEE